jgi:hypothetical protein
MSVKYDLNLLPENLQISKNLGNFLKTARALGIIFMVAFVIFAVSVGGVFVFSKINLTKIQTNVEQLKNEVKSRESSEQQLVLLKDRLAKITSVRSSSNTIKKVMGVNSLFANISPSSSLSQANISSSKIDVSMVIGTNEDLTTIMQNLKNTKDFGSVTLTSLNLGPGGFALTVNLKDK